MTATHQRTADEPALTASLVVLRDTAGRPVGAGFLVTHDLVVTCSHVLREVLRGTRDEDSPAPATVPAQLILPSQGTGPPRTLAATVEHYHPEPRTDLDDVAVLRLPDPVAGARAVRLVDAGDRTWGHRARAFGFPEGRPEGVWHPGIMRGTQAGGLLQMDAEPGAAYEISRGFSGAPVWDDDLDGVVGMVVRTDTARPAAFLIPVGALAVASGLLEPLLEPPSPFPGLSPFGEHQADVFFGRDDESAAIADLVRSNPVVAILGASGCGKSSAVRAGVVPRLREAGLAVVAVRAGPAPLGHALAAELTALTQPELSGEARIQAIRDTRAGLAEHGLEAHVSDAIWRGHDGLVVVVDQLEELLAETGAATAQGTPGPTRAARELLFPQPPIPGLHVVTTVRTDYVPAVSEHPELRPAVRGQMHLLPEMTAEQLWQAVVRPVATVPGSSYQGTLDAVIVDEIAESPGALPLLAFTLDQLWQRRQGGQLTFSAYHELHGVHGALRAHAEESSRRCEAAGLVEPMWRLLLRLMHLPPGGGAPVRIPAPHAELDPPMRRVAEILAAARLVVIRSEDGDFIVELAHEILIGAWPGLKKRIDRDRDFLTWRDRLRELRRQWDEAGRPGDLLPTATSLEQAKKWRPTHGDELGADDREFLQRGSRRQRRRTWRRLSLFVALTLVVALASAFGALFVNQTQVSRDRAAESTSRSLAATSAELRERDPELSIMLALAAYQVDPTDQARDNLLQSHVHFRHVEWLLPGVRTPGGKLAASRDGRVVLGAGFNGRVTVHRRDRGGHARREELPWDPALGYALDQFVSPDGTRAGYVSAAGPLVWFEVGTAATGLTGALNQIPGPPLALASDPARRTVAISVDGSRVAAVTDRRLVVWDLDRGVVAAEWPVPPDLTQVNSLWFGPDPDTVLIDYVHHQTVDIDTTTKLVSITVATGEARELMRDFFSVGVSGDGTTAVACEYEGSYHTMDVATGRVRDVALGRDCSNVGAVDHTGRYIAVGYDHTGLEVFEIAAGQPPTRLPGPASDPALDEWVGNLHRSIIEADGDLFVLTQSRTGTALLRQPSHSDGEVVLDPLRLTPDGSMIVGFTVDSNEVYVRAADDEDADPLRAERGEATLRPEHQEIAIDDSSSLLADRVTEERIEIRDLATLEVVSAIEPEPMPDDASSLDRPVWRFAGGSYLLTQSAAVLELWDVWSGARQARVDLADLGMRYGAGYRDANRPAPTVSPHPVAGLVAVVDGSDTVRVVDLFSTQEVPELRFETGDEVLSAVFLPDEDHVVIVRPGGASWELWRLDPRRLELGPVANACNPCTVNDVFTVRYPGAGRVLMASGDTVTIHAPGEQQPVERYSFGEPARFHGVSNDGTTVLFNLVDHPLVSVVRLDRPDAWQERLCEVLGWRDPTEIERAQLTTDFLTDPVCHPPG